MILKTTTDDARIFERQLSGFFKPLRVYIGRRKVLAEKPLVSTAVVYNGAQPALEYVVTVKQSRFYGRLFLTEAPKQLAFTRATIDPLMLCAMLKQAVKAKGGAFTLGGCHFMVEKI